MTIGEKIQKQRMQLGLSQEELGKKLLVSRQTISFWENNQTVPTIDNLIRLKEILGMSVDEMLGLEPDTKNQDSHPLEEYKFNYTKEELHKIKRLQINNVCKIPGFLVMALFFFTIVSIGFSGFSFATGLGFSCLFFSIIILILVIRANKRNWESSILRISKSTYKYNVYEDYFCVDIYRENEDICSTKFALSDIEKIRQLDKWVLVQICGQIYILKISDLKHDSVFLPAYHQNTSATKATSDNKGWHMLSVVLFVSSILSIMGVLCLIAIISEINMMFVENMWICFVFVPIPVASIIFYFFARHRGYKFKKNIIAGLIMTVLLCVYGSFSFIFADMFDHSDAPVVMVEQMTGIDIPEYKIINTQRYADKEHSAIWRSPCSESNVYFTASSVKDFEKELATDDRWMTSIPTNLAGIIPREYSYDIYDYTLVYNIDTSKYNSLPGTDGRYHYISVFYNIDDNEMVIIEYYVDYIR